MSETRRYLARNVHGATSAFPYDVIDTLDGDRVILGSIPGTVMIDVVEALNAAYEQGQSESRALSRPLPSERPLSEDHVRELRAEELRLRVQHEQTGERLAAISAVLVASGEARLKQHQEARQ